MKVTMYITGIDGEVVVSTPDTYTIKEEDLVKGTITRVFDIDGKQARAMAIEKVCMIKETDIDVIAIRR